MRYLWQHVFAVLDGYDGTLPLHHYLKAYYKKHPVLGSRDRRGISDALYSWYRSGKAFTKDPHPREEQVAAAMLLCGVQPRAFRRFFPESWQPVCPAAPELRAGFLQQEGFHIDLTGIFPYDIALSAGIDRPAWTYAVLQQPGLFLRIRKDKAGMEQILTREQIPFRWLDAACLALPNGTAVEGLLPPDAYVIQDASSQATGRYFGPAAQQRWWDCCSGAGGKSLLLKDMAPDIQLVVSDVRDSILSNLRSRFRLYGLQQPEALVIDAADPASIRRALGDRQFHAVLCDVPCTGSGTWARTPEGLYFFDPQALRAYSRRSLSILRNAAGRIEPGGKVIYMTCSVFRSENEAVVEQAAQECGLEITAMQLINGTAHRADCLFAAVLTRPAGATS